MTDQILNGVTFRGYSATSWLAMCLILPDTMNTQSDGEEIILKSPSLCTGFLFCCFFLTGGREIMHFLKKNTIMSTDGGYYLQTTEGQMPQEAFVVT